MTEPQITYGLGGWDPEHPNGNVVERVVDHGDGTGTRTFFGPDGQEIGTEPVVGLPLAEPTSTVDLSALLATVTEKAEANRAIADGGPTSMTRTIARNAADGLDAVAEILTTLTTPT